MPIANPPSPMRMKVINQAVIEHVMKHPARRAPWGLRELAGVLGCSPGTISHLRDGTRQSFPAVLCERFAEAVGVQPAVLFEPAVSTESDDTTALEAVAG